MTFQIKKNQEQLFIFNDEIDGLYKSYRILKEKQDNCNLDIVVLENLEKISATRDKMIISQISNNKNLKKQEKEKIIQEKLILFRQSTQKEYLMREDQLKHKRSELADLSNRINKLKGDIEKKLECKAEVKMTISSLKNEMLVHYHKLLHKGTDVRKDGLTWILQEIWNLGEKVQIRFMPKFLDEKAIDHLFTVSSFN